MRMHAVLLLTTMLVVVPTRVRAADDVTIYRCTDASGHLTLRDTPCRKDQTQQTRTMLRPKDTPIAPVQTSPSQASPPQLSHDSYPSSPPRLLVVHAPRPLYECIPVDGEAYTSDNDEGHPRWVPLWSLGFPGTVFSSPGMASTAGLSITHGNVRIDGRNTLLVPPAFNVAGANTWIRDACHELPQDEVCARLVDRRDALRRRFFNAMPSERDVLNLEERGIMSRLNNDCRAP